MNLLVCISKTPETSAKIAFKDENSSFDTDGVQFIMNPYDEWYALVRALELKEQHGGKVTAINVGDSSNDPVIRKALAIGADEAVRVDIEATSSFFVAKQVAEYAKSNDIDIVFTGKETIDYNLLDTKLNEKKVNSNVSNNEKIQKLKNIIKGECNRTIHCDFKKKHVRRKWVSMLRDYENIGHEAFVEKWKKL